MTNPQPLVVACDGVLLEPLGLRWVGFSPLSGETVILDDASAAVLELLKDAGPCTGPQIVTQLAADAGVAEVEISAVVEGTVQQLQAAGLLRLVPPPGA